VTIANERPYLWLLYVIVLVMPFVLCAACCVRSKVSLFIKCSMLARAVFLIITFIPPKYVYAPKAISNQWRDFDFKRLVE